MQYMILIYSEERNVQPSQEEMAAWFKYTDDLKTAGVYVAGDALQPTATATTIRVRNGDTVHTDGPFAETKEALGGYYLVNCDSLDEAKKWGAACPASHFGSIEVRPIVKFD